MALTVTTVNGGAGRVVLGANGRPAHVIELGPIYVRVEIAGFDTLALPPGGMAHGSMAAQHMALYFAVASGQQRQRAGAYAASAVRPGGLALGVPA